MSTPDNITVREATKDDAMTIFETENEIDNSQPFLPSEIEDKIHFGPTHIAETNDGEMVGYLLVGYGWYVNSYYVEPEYRDQGIEDELIERADVQRKHIPVDSWQDPERWKEHGYHKFNERKRDDGTIVEVYDQDPDATPGPPDDYSTPNGIKPIEEHRFHGDPDDLGNGYYGLHGCMHFDPELAGE